MIIAVDIGNTNISVACFSNGIEPDFVKKYPDNRYHTAEEIYKEFSFFGVSFSCAVLCSVVPPLTSIVKEALMRLTKGNVLVIDSGFNDGLKISGYDRKKLGNDRVADMTAVKTLYGTPAVVFDMGTATTVSVLDREGVFIGGLILPGLSMSVNALSSGTALLPGINLFKPDSFLGQDTVSCINNGVIYSQASSLEGIIMRTEDELGEKVTAVATGGAAKLILPFVRRKIIFDEHLLFKGMKILAEGRNEQVLFANRNEE